MTQIVTAGDIAGALGRPLEKEETQQVDFWVKTTLAIIKSRLGDVEKLDQDNLALVVTSAVARLARNPEGLESVRIDDYSYRIGSSGRDTQITITDQEWSLLTPRRVRALGSIGAASHIGDRYGDYTSW